MYFSPEEKYTCDILLTIRVINEIISSMEARLTDGCPMFLYRGLIFYCFLLSVCNFFHNFTTVISLPERKPDLSDNIPVFLYVSSYNAFRIRLLALSIADVSNEAR